MHNEDPAKALIENYNNVIRRFEFIQTLMVSLISLREELEEFLSKDTKHATVIIMAIKIQIKAAL